MRLMRLQPLLPPTTPLPGFLGSFAVLLMLLVQRTDR